MNYSKILLILLLLAFCLPTNARNHTTEDNVLSPLIEKEDIEGGEAVAVSVLQDHVSEEFVSQIDSKQKETQGLKTLTVGMLAPDFTSKDDNGNTIHFHDYKTNCRYKLVLFWSADCNYCKHLVSKLYPWYEQIKDKNLLDVLAISVDETRTEIPKWEQAKAQLPAWRHIRVGGGMNGQEVSDFFVYITPEMVLVDSQTNKIVALPKTVKQLSEALAK